MPGDIVESGPDPDRRAQRQLDAALMPPGLVYGL